MDLLYWPLLTLILDLRTLLIVMMTTSLLLAVSLMVAVGPQFRDGLGKWTASMLLQAVMFGLYFARGIWPDFATIVLPNALFLTCMTLQAAAIREFHGRTTSVWWHVLPMLLALVQFTLVMDNFLARVVLNGALFGAGMLALAILVQRLNPEERGSARWLLLTGYLIGAVTMCVRVILSIIEPGIFSSLLAICWTCVISAGGTSTAN